MAHDAMPRSTRFRAATLVQSGRSALRGVAVRRLIDAVLGETDRNAGDEFESRGSAKIALMLCWLFCEAGIDEAFLHDELLAMADDPPIAVQLLRIFATNARLAERFHAVHSAAAAALGRSQAQDADGRACG